MGYVQEVQLKKFGYTEDGYPYISLRVETCLIPANCRNC